MPVERCLCGEAFCDIQGWGSDGKWVECQGTREGLNLLSDAGPGPLSPRANGVFGMEGVSVSDRLHLLPTPLIDKPPWPPMETPTWHPPLSMQAVYRQSVILKTRRSVVFLPYSGEVPCLSTTELGLRAPRWSRRGDYEGERMSSESSSAGAKGENVTRPTFPLFPLWSSSC